MDNKWISWEHQIIGTDLYAILSDPELTNIQLAQGLHYLTEAKSSVLHVCNNHITFTVTYPHGTFRTNVIRECPASDTNTFKWSGVLVRQKDGTFLPE
uniref:Uncharacterized protein n=1 Tax=Pseudomonas phage vB_PaeM_FBPa36 TaxID=3231237 RepID=A0AAU8KW69_9VIRU